MALQKVKFEAGQTWFNGSEKFTITRVGALGSGSTAALHRERGDEWPFAYCQEDGSGEISYYWKLIPQVTSSAPKSRECKCGIFRGDCTYHKDQ